MAFRPGRHATVLPASGPTSATIKASDEEETYVIHTVADLVHRRWREW